eukprot:scaffold14885_cov65-Phaeocystis_antarctica.AAC.14
MHVPAVGPTADALLAQEMQRNPAVHALRVEVRRPVRAGSALRLNPQAQRRAGLEQRRAHAAAFPNTQVQSHDTIAVNVPAVEPTAGALFAAVMQRNPTVHARRMEARRPTQAGGAPAPAPAPALLSPPLLSPPLTLARPSGLPPWVRSTAWAGRWCRWEAGRTASCARRCHPLAPPAGCKRCEVSRGSCGRTTRQAPDPRRDAEACATCRTSRTSPRSWVGAVHIQHFLSGGEVSEVHAPVGTSHPRFVAGAVPRRCSDPLVARRSCALLQLQPFRPGLRHRLFGAALCTRSEQLRAHTTALPDPQAQPHGNVLYVSVVIAHVHAAAPPHPRNRARPPQLALISAILPLDAVAHAQLVGKHITLLLLILIIHCLQLFLMRVVGRCQSDLLPSHPQPLVLRRWSRRCKGCPQALVAHHRALARELRLAAKHRAALVLRSVVNEVGKVAPELCVSFALGGY